MDETKRTNLGASLFHSVSWLLSAGLLVLDMWLVVNAVNASLVGSGVRRQIVDLVWFSMLLGLGCVGVACAVIIDVYYRRSKGTLSLLKRSLFVVGIEVVVGAVASLVRYLVVAGA